jgi:SulP family sulfate permease
MINVTAIRTVAQTNKVARAVMLVTFASTLLMPLQYAVFLGVAISILLVVLQQSNALRIVEWDVQGTGWPVEKPVPVKLESNRATVLYVYGSLFFAAADTFEKSLPAVDGARRAAVIMLLRGYDDIGATVIGVLHRYTESLQANDGRLILAGVSPALRGQLQRTGMLALIGDQNIFPVTQTIGEAGNAALQSAIEWLGESQIKEIT